MSIERDELTCTLDRFMKDNVGTGLELRILSFCSRHDAAYSQSVIAYAIDASKSEIQRALESLERKGLLVRRQADGVFRYSLAPSKAKQRLIRALAACSGQGLDTIPARS